MKKRNAFILSVIIALLFSTSLFAGYTADLTGSGTASASSYLGDWDPAITAYLPSMAFNNNTSDLHDQPASTIVIYHISNQNESQAEYLPFVVRKELVV